VFRLRSAGAPRHRLSPEGAAPCRLTLESIAAGQGAGPVRGLAASPPALPPDIAGALQVIAAWGITERGARTLGNLLILAPAAAGMPPDVARCWDRLAQLSLRPLAGPAEPDGHVARLAAELLGETDERRRLIMTSRTFAPDKRTYDSLARELGISRERVRQLEGDGLTRLTQAARQRTGGATCGPCPGTPPPGRRSRRCSRRRPRRARSPPAAGHDTGRGPTGHEPPAQPLPHRTGQSHTGWT
jgi:hypothetical protein